MNAAGVSRDDPALVDSYPACGLYATAIFALHSGKQQPAMCAAFLSLFEGIMENYFQSLYARTPRYGRALRASEKLLYRRFGGFPVGVTSGEDLLTWARIAVKNNMLIPQVAVPSTI